MQHFCNWLPNAAANVWGNLMKTHNWGRIEILWAVQDKGQAMESWKWNIEETFAWNGGELDRGYTLLVNQAFREWHMSMAYDGFILHQLISVPTVLKWNMNWKVWLLCFVGLCVAVGWFSLRPKLGLKDLEDGNVEYKVLSWRAGNVLQGMMFTVDRSWIMTILLICHSFAFGSFHNWIYNDLIQYSFTCNYTKCYTLRPAGSIMCVKYVYCRRTSYNTYIDNLCILMLHWVCVPRSAMHIAAYSPITDFKLQLVPPSTSPSKNNDLANESVKDTIRPQPIDSEGSSSKWPKFCRCITSVLRI